jgi:HEAT repeat protein
MRTGFAVSRSVLGAALVSCAAALAPDRAAAQSQDAALNVRVQQAIAKAAGYLEANLKNEPNEGVRALAALALVKSNVPVSSPALQGAIQEVLNRVTNGEYKPGSHHVYQAGVEATLLADANAAVFRPQIEAIAKYIMAQQLPNGGWDYPAGRQGHGDTSVTQYACLGLWAAARAGVEIPVNVWDQAIAWHLATPNPDGGFRYVPGTEEGAERGGSSINLTLAALGSMLICARHTFPGRADSLAQLLGLKEERSTTQRDRFGVLEQVDLTRVKEAAAEGGAPGPTNSVTSIEQFKQVVQRAFGWASGRVGPTKGDAHYAVYYYYTLERAGALADIEQFGRFTWFDGCANELIPKQAADGHWSISTFNVRDTAFVTLFLTRSTGKILRPTRPPDPIGGGLAKGHRGGLDDIGSIGRDGTTQKSLGALDDLLKLLETPGDVDLQDVQEQIVEQVQISDRKALIGQKELLVRYARHPNAEVRRTAIWALGRTDDFSLAKLLIGALDDPDLGVLIEARNALCWLARKPNGLGETANPHENLPENATEEQKLAATATWHADLVRKWGTWYLQNRPYADRGDEFEAELLQKIASAR